MTEKFNCFFINRPDKEKLIEILPKIDGWICHPSPEYKIDYKILKHAPNLKIISTPSTGTTHLDEIYCEKKNIKILPITVSNKFHNIKASSEFTFLLCILAFKKIFKAINEVKTGNWRNTEDILRGNEIIGKKIGIFGYGRIGKNLTKYFNSMGANVFYNDTNLKLKSKKWKSKEYLLKNSDLIVMCISYNKKNFNFVDKNFLNKLKKRPIFVNTSRGEIVDEKYLLKALKSKIIRAAYLDVIKKEQNLNLKKNALINYSKKKNNLIISPHMAGLTYESEEKAFLISVGNIIKYFKA